MSDVVGRRPPYRNFESGGRGNFLKFFTQEGPIFCTRSRVAWHCRRRASLQAVSISSLKGAAVLVRVFSMSRRRARFLKIAASAMTINPTTQRLRATVKNTRMNAIFKIYSPSGAETMIYEQTFSDRGSTGLRRSRTDLMTGVSISLAGTRRSDPARSPVPWEEGGRQIVSVGSLDSVKHYRQSSSASQLSYGPGSDDR